MECHCQSEHLRLLCPSAGLYPDVLRSRQTGSRWSSVSFPLSFPDSCFSGRSQSTSRPLQGLTMGWRCAGCGAGTAGFELPIQLPSPTALTGTLALMLRGPSTGRLGNSDTSVWLVPAFLPREISWPCPCLSSLVPLAASCVVLPRAITLHSLILSSAPSAGRRVPPGAETRGV